MPAPLPQISALPLQPLSLNPSTLPSVSLQEIGGPLLLPSVSHARAPLLPELRLCQGVLPLLPSNMPAPLSQISAFPLQRGVPRLQTSVVNPNPPISALLLQQGVLPLQPSSMRAADAPPPLSVSIQGRGRPPPPPSAVRVRAPLLSALLPQLFDSPLHPKCKSSSSYSDFSLSYLTICASSSASIRVCSSSSALRLASRERQTPYSIFNFVRLCSSSFCLASSERCASS